MNKLKQYPFLYKPILSVLNKLNYFDWKFHRNFSKYQLTDRWKYRISEVVKSPDNRKIHHVPNAGQLFQNYQLMHNGLKIRLGSYYDYGNTVLLLENQGVHEPQEEYVFQEVLKSIAPGGVILELGSYWAFYSMWFHLVVPNASCYMVEPDLYKMNFGKLNFALNNMKGKFINGFIGSKSDHSSNVPTLTVDEILHKYKIEHLAILHSDIQGFEYEMLMGAKAALQKHQIDFIFISTHSNELHNLCIEALTAHHYQIIADANLNETYSWDGLIVAHSRDAPITEAITIAKNNAES